MKLSEIKKHLASLAEVKFELPDKSQVPAHFHVTEVGQTSKSFIDCGGTIRHEKKVNFQLWQAGDFDHRLAPQKLLSIIELSEKKLGIEDTEIEVEYQSNTIGKYNLDFNGTNFLLVATQTNCLAEDACGIPQEKIKIKLSNLANNTNSCKPGSGCC